MTGLPSEGATSNLNATLTIVDIGHGSCSVLSDGSVTILIDAGPGSSVLEYLRQENITRIDCVILSHSDADHINGAVALLGASEFTVGEIIANSDAIKTSALWDNLVWELDVRSREGTIKSSAQLREGDPIMTQVRGAELTVLAPRTALAMTGPGSRDRNGRPVTANTMSAVMLVSVGDRRVALLTGDLDEVGLENLLDTGQSIRADILVFPHHGGLAGGSGASARQFAVRLTEAVQPREIIFSLDRHRYGTPRPEIIAGVREGAPSARIACTQLSESCAAELPQGSPVHLLPLFAKGAERNSCCAGTMRIHLAGGELMEPNTDVHGPFISQFSSTALCVRYPQSV